MAPDGEYGYVDPEGDIGLVMIASTTSDGGVQVVQSEGVEYRKECKMMEGEVCWMTSEARVERGRKEDV